MRLSLIAATAACALMASPVLAQDSTFSDETLGQYADALEVIMPIAQAAAGSPSPEQQTQMAEAVTNAGLTPEQFNAIATASQSDAVLQARIELAAEPEPAADSVSATVTDEEIGQFAQAMVGIRAASGGSSSPTPEQQAAMAEAVTASGLTIDRFNVIGGGVNSDTHLRARVALAEAELAG